MIQQDFEQQAVTAATAAAQQQQLISRNGETSSTSAVEHEGSTILKRCQEAKIKNFEDVIVDTHQSNVYQGEWKTVQCAGEVHKL